MSVSATDNVQLNYTNNAGDYTTINNAAVSTKGDVNNDNSIDATDLRLVKMELVLLDTSEYTYSSSEAAAIDGQSGVTTRDLLFLRQGIVGTRSLSMLRNTDAPATAYNSANDAAVISADSDGVLRVTLNTSGLNVSNAKSLNFCYKCTTSGTATVYSNGSAIYTFYATADSDFHSVMVNYNFPTDTVIMVEFPSNSVNDKVYVDSIGISSDTEAAEASATAREIAKNGVGGDNVTKLNGDFVALDFNSSFDYSKFYSASNTQISEYDAENDAFKLSNRLAENDPFIFLNLSSYNISADTYKYIVYVYKLDKDSSTSPNPDSQMFFHTGSSGNLREETSLITTLSRTGQFGYQIYDFHSNTNCAGTYEYLRLDYFTSPTIGDIQYLDSIIFCRSEDSAEYYASKYTEAANNNTAVYITPPSDAEEIREAILTEGITDEYSSEYVKNGRICITAGIPSGFTAARLKNRLEDYIKKSLGVNAEVTVLSGYEMLKSQYDANCSAEANVSLKISDGDSAWVCSIPCGVYIKEVIFDNDNGSDCDDGGAIAVLTKLHMQGYCKLMAVTSCIYGNNSSTSDYDMNGRYACKNAELIIKYFKDNYHGDSTDGILIGCTTNTALDDDTWHGCSKYALEQMGLTNYASYTYPSAESVIRSCLNNSHGNVTVVTTGALSTIDSYLSNSADKTLFEQKVGHFVIGGGSFPGGTFESNFSSDNEAAISVLNNLLNVNAYKVTFVGCEVAGTAISGQFLASGYGDYVLKYSYAEETNGSYQRPSWDQGVVTYAVWGTGCGLYGTIDNKTVRSTGGGCISIADGGSESYVFRIATVSKLADIFNNYMKP